MFDRIFEESIKVLKGKDKIKVGFVIHDASMWCGDELYKKFEQSERYEPTVFMCLRQTRQTALVREEFVQFVEKFKAKNLNMIAVNSSKVVVPKQDVLIYLTPYFPALPPQFREGKITAETLITYTPYSLQTNMTKKFPIYSVLWKLFAVTKRYVAALFDNIGLNKARVVYSGAPKLDSIVSNSDELKFEWKEAQPNPVKIIWSPHWTLGRDGGAYSTFAFNYKFMYEYAKAHPETSWVVKPHPHLSFSVVREKLFSSTAVLKEYYKKWDELPNGQVVRGGYYQSIFATSDGILNDSGSFTLEYQYTHKPMLMLMRRARPGTLLTKITAAQYQAGGKDFKGIEKFIEDILIKKSDPRAEERQQVFDEELNYYKDNGMLASDMIFKTIDDALSK